MKRFQKWLFLALAVMVLGTCLLAMPTEAETGEVLASGICGPDLTWVLTDDGVLTISGTGEMYDLGKYDKAKWTGYGSIKTVVIEPGVTYIGEYVFYKTNGTNSITRVSIPDTVEKIGKCAFFAQPIEELVIPDSVYYVGVSAFAFCRELGKLTVNAQTIDDYAFQNCEALTDVTIGIEVNEIGAQAFGSAYEDVEMLRKNVYIDDLRSWCLTDFATGQSNPMYYGADLYLDGQRVTDLEVPSTVNKYAFWGCDTLVSLTVPEGVGSIGQNAFYGCTGLTAATVSAESIGEKAFYGCTGLMDIVINSESIGKYAFEGCSNLTNVTFGDDVTSIGDHAFAYCGSLSAVELTGNENARIGDAAFFDCDGLTHVTIGTVKSIGDSAFSICENLTDVYIGSAAIGEQAFYLCSAMTDLTVEAGTVEDKAFYRCRSLARVTLGSGVSSISSGAFSSCDNIVEMTIPFVGMQHGIPGYFESFFTASLNGSVSGRNVPNSLRTVTILDGCTKLTSNAFFGCDMITAIYLPESLTDIGYGAFWACDNLKLITIGSGVTEIDYATFNECDELWHVLFTGTEEQWNAISVGESNSILETVKIHYNCTGDETIDVNNKVCLICRANCEHSWDNGAITKEATCGESGVKTYTCTICGTTKEETIGALGHNEVIDVVVDPTCIATGLTEGKHCDRCGEVLVAQTEVAATGHSYGDWYTVIGATCTADGQQRRDCENCDHYETEVIASAGHRYTSVVTAPTCTAGGYTTHTCATCGDSYVDSYTDAMGHSYGDWYVVTEPGEYEDGLEQRDCLNCDHSETRTIPALGHTHSYEESVTAPTCTQDGAKVYTCRCGDTYTEAIPATGHDYTSVVTAPTCTENGYTTHTCMSCGDSYTDAPVAATGHQYESVTVEPTCTETGSITYTCHCGHSYTEELPATGHSFADGKCAHCGASEVLLGDVNGDGKVNARDARLLLRYVAGLATEEEIILAAADFNGDSRINARDARLLLRYAAGLVNADEIDLAAADYNGDGKINARDARAVLRFAAGLD